MGLFDKVTSSPLLPLAAAAAGAYLSGGTSLGMTGGALLGGSIGASIYGTNAAQQGQQQANQANLDLSAQQMQFQERMSSSAYQRSMADMQKAGLNPMLAYSQGGASTPQGQMATMQNENQALATLGSSAIEIGRLKRESEQMGSQVELNKQLKETANAQKTLNEANAKSAEANARRINAETPGVKAESDYNVKQREYDTKALPFDNSVKRARQLIGGASDAMDILKPKININRKPPSSTKVMP